MKTVIKLTLLGLLLLSVVSADAQRYRRYSRRHDRVHEDIEKAERSGKISQDEADDIQRKEKKLHRTNRKALRNGHVSGHEQNKMNRRLRRVKRETRRDGRG